MPLHKYSFKILQRSQNISYLRRPGHTVARVVCDAEDEALVIQNENYQNNVQGISEKPTKKAEANAVQKKLDQEEQLILKVMKRTPLWDITIPLSQRGKLVKRKLWMEVSEPLKGCFTADGAQKRFKRLKDTYRKMIQHEKRPSGSAAKAHTTKWSHYKSMDYLRPQINSRQTTCNLEEEGAEANSEDSDGTEFEPQQPIKRPAKRKRYADPESESLMSSFDKIAAAISESSKEIILPPPPVQDEIDSCVSLNACRLRKIPEKHQSAAVNNMLNHSFEVLQMYQNE